MILERAISSFLDNEVLNFADCKTDLVGDKTSGQVMRSQTF